MCGASCCGSVAVDVFGSAVLGSVVVIVAEVPRFAGADGSLAAPTSDLSCGYARCPCGSELIVLSVVPALLFRAATFLVVGGVFGAVALAGGNTVRAGG